MLVQYEVLAKAQNIEVRIDTDIAKQVVAEICSGEMASAEHIRHSQYVQDMISHFSQFRDYFTIENYLSARQNAARCKENTPDYFRFNQLIKNKKQVQQDIQVLQDLDPSSIKSLIVDYIPEGISFSGAAVVAVGTPSCGGWSKGQNFYVDLPCIAGDTKGLIYLSAHETFHAVQSRFMHEPDEKQYIMRLLNQVIREGSATAVADFNELPAGGKYTDLSQRELKTNARRLQQNFDLLDTLVAYLKLENTEAAYQNANNIGLSGSYTAPLYSVGAKMFNTIEAQSGRKTLLCLLQKPAIDIMSYYHALSKNVPDLQTFGPQVQSLLKEGITSC
jgi:hypothetical protein